MSIHIRKLSLIQYLISLKDETLFKKIESTVLELQENNYKTFTEEELILRAKEAEIDYQNNHFTTQEELEKESENW